MIRFKYKQKPSAATPLEACGKNAGEETGLMFIDPAGDHPRAMLGCQGLQHARRHYADAAHHRRYHQYAIQGVFSGPVGLDTSLRRR